MPDKREEVFGAGSEDYRQAEWLARNLKGQWRFDWSEGVWHHFDGIRWATDKTGQIRRTCSTMAAKALGSAENETMRKALIRLLSLAPLDKALEALATFTDYGTDGSDWDTDPYLLGCKNGIVDLRQNTLIPAMSEQNVSRNTGTNFKPISSPKEFAERAPLFMSFLYEVTSDHDFTTDGQMVLFLLRWFGAGLFGMAPEQRFLMMTGGGRNGKGALKTAVRAALGDEYSCEPDGNLYSRNKFGPARANEARADLMGLHGRRIAFCSEPDRGQFNEEMLKAHTGGDMITARSPYQRATISWTPTHSITFLVNNAPSLEDLGTSMGARVMVADFRHRYEGENEDKNLYDKLKAEKEGILAILCWAAKDWYDSWSAGEGGLELPERIVEQSQAFIERNDPIAEFLRASTAYDPAATVSGQVIYDAYQTWHVRGGADGEPMSMVKFAYALEKRGFTRYRSTTSRGWKGIRLLNAMEQADRES